MSCILEKAQIALNRLLGALLRVFREKALGFHGGSAGKESACIVEDLGSSPRLERFPGEGNDYPLQYPCLENSIERGTWQATAHGVAKRHN